MTHTTPMRQRLMLVIWSWWKRSDPAFPEAGYETWQVEGNAQDRLYLVSEQTDYAALIRSLLADQPRADVLAFLHRRSHDPVKDLSDITDALKSPSPTAWRKAFAFSDGRDYLYLSANEWGLIGNEGRLWYSSGGEKMRSAEAASMTVRRANFDKVWQYYAHQCKRKIFEFKEELLSALWTSPFAQDSDAVENQDWLGIFKKEKPLLYARLLDLANEDSPRFSVLLDSAEQRSAEKLRFGECRLNLTTLSEAGPGKEYERLADFIRNGIVNAEGPVRVAESMRALRDCFDELLEAMPEPTYP